MRGVSAAVARPEALLSLLMLGLSATAIVQIWDAPLRARQFPLLIAVPMLLLALYQLATDLRRGRPPWTGGAGVPRGRTPCAPTSEAGGTPAPQGAGGWRAIAWFVGFFAGVSALGFQPAIPLYTFLYLRVAARERLTTSLALALAAWGAFQLLFVRLLHVPLFPGWLFQALGLD